MLQEASQIPHAVYWMYNSKMELLFIGCSYRLTAHLDQQANRAGIRNGKSWITEVAAIKVKWYPNRYETQEAEAKAILAKKPKYNMHWNSQQQPRETKPGACPNCGRLKLKHERGYCTECAKAYQHDRTLRIRAGTWHDQ